MPKLNVSDSVMKYALETIRVPISILGDCPQCGSNGFRDGICPDCAFIHPNVQAAIQEWQAAMGIQQTEEQMKQTPKAAFRSLSFVEVLPGNNNFNGYDLSGVSSGKVKCPQCGDLTFVNDSLKKGEISGSCENPKCGHEIAGALGFKRPKFLGIDPRMLKKVKRNFLSPASLKIEENKKKLEKNKKKGAAEQQQQPMDLGALQDDSMNAHNDATTRMKQFLQQGAGIEAQQNYQIKQENANNSEEQQ
jgi:hypothetical protein